MTDAHNGASMPKAKWQIFMFSITLAIALPKIEDCHPDQSKMKIFKELCTQVVPDGNNKVANHTQNLTRNWALVTQKRIDLEKVGVNFENDMSKYS